jgi:hypothetical protein
MNPNALRKQLLVAESELQRAQLSSQLIAGHAVVRSLLDRSSSYGSMVSSAAVLMAGLAAFQRARTPDSEPRFAWLPNVLKVAGLISTVWLAIRARSHPTAQD